MRQVAMLNMISALLVCAPLSQASEKTTAQASTPIRFEPTFESLKQYKCPEWFRDAKFGIWAVWGPQSVLEQGDWYARQMYIEGHPQYLHHLKTFGHPSKHGYKDIIQLWKAEKWEPDRLMTFYKQAGAKYFVAIANHHDNFDCWESKFHRWNSVNYGPKRDIVGLWRQAALKQGLRFGVTEHNARSISWMQTSHGADKQGPMAGIPYDGNDPANQDLYHRPFADHTCNYPANPPEYWKEEWFKRSQDLLDTYHPDLFYFDGGYPYGEVGRRLVAHYYNTNMQEHGGKLEAVMNVKNVGWGPEYVDGTCVEDIERGITEKINPLPWQTDTCIGDWYYKKGFPYKSPATVVGMLADIVSKNGNLLLNVPLKGDGSIDAEEETVLRGIGAWLSVNGEAIYGTRPWKTFGEGTTRTGEGAVRYNASDFRFTLKGDILYAIALGWPATEGSGTSQWVVRSLPKDAGKVEDVSVLGYDGKLEWSQTDQGLVVTPPERKPCEIAWSLKIRGQNLQPIPVCLACGETAGGRHGCLTFRACEAEIRGATPVYEKDSNKDQIGGWSDPKDFVSWTANVKKPGKYKVSVTYSCANGAEGSLFVVEAGDVKLESTSQASGSWSSYRSDNIGMIELTKSGRCTIAVKPKAEHKWKVIGLKTVVLTPL